MNDGTAEKERLVKCGRTGLWERVMVQWGCRMCHAEDRAYCAGCLGDLTETGTCPTARDRGKRARLPVSAGRGEDNQ